MSKRTMAINLVLCLLLVPLVFATGNKDVSSNADGDKPVELTMLLPHYQLGRSGFNDEFFLNAFIEKVEQETNTKLEIICPPSSDLVKKTFTLYSAGDGPDITYINSPNQHLPILVQRDQILMLDDLIANSEILSNIDKKYFDYTAVDGHYYSIPDNIFRGKIMFGRKDIYDELGLEFSSTPSIKKFYNDLVTIRDKKGIVPYTMNEWIEDFQFILSSFGATIEIIKDENGVFYDGFNTQEMRDGLDFMAKLYREGLFDPEFAVNKLETARTKMITGEAVVMVEYSTRMDRFYTAAESDGYPEAVYSPIYEIKGPNGEGEPYNLGIKDGIIIGKNTKNIEKVMEVIEYLWFTPEGQRLTKFGVEGTHFVINDQGKIEPREDAVANGYRVVAEPIFFSHNDLELPFKFPEVIENTIPKTMEIADELASNYWETPIARPLGIVDSVDHVYSDIKAKRNELIIKIIMNIVSVEEGLAEYDKYMKSIKGETLLADLNSSGK
jgi:putative aldouronate transport system substrate-binding protein